MSVSQLLNPKGIIKKSSTNDLPFSPIQPVISHYTAVSTASQTIINLNFTMDLSLTDQFQLYIDGKLLTLGSANDYTFTAVAADHTSSQVTLNYAIPISLNIQAFKLGLKKESEFQTDNRFVQLYAEQDSGFQCFASQTDHIMTATNVAGTPAAGTFYSTIVKRASMVDLSQDLKARMGVERVPTQQISQIQNESGPNGEPVWGVSNDTFGQIRCIGYSWVNNGSGPYGNGAVSTATNDYAEFTFYGTGVNFTSALDLARDIRVSVDGGAEGGNIYPATANNILGARNYNAKVILNLAFGLSPGVHTLKIRLNNATNLGLQDFEVINESSSVKVNPGVGYVQGKQYVTSAQSVFSYSSVVTGTAGGRVLVYQNGDGSIGKAFTPTNPSPAFLTSADHTNEEVVRTYYPREFGAGRADDFALLGAARGAAFTLDDNDSTLLGTSVVMATVNGIEGVGWSGVNSYITFQFTGTGLDVQFNTNGFTGTFQYSVDNNALASFPVAGTGFFNMKVASGLPYGTHTAVFKVTALGTGSAVINNFTIYQPKKPALPSGTVELAAYNVLANYVVNAGGGVPTSMATGVLRRTQMREFQHIGTGWAASQVPSNTTGWNITTNTNGDFCNYVFFGTGFEHRFGSTTAVTVTFTVTVDGQTNLTTANGSPVGGIGWSTPPTTSFYGGGVASFTASTGTVVTNTVGSSGSGIQVSGLPLGWHIVKITKTAGTNMFPETFDLITPIHSHKPNLYSDLGNTLLIGGCGVEDKRKTTPTKDALPAIKAWAQAKGVTVSPTTTSLTAVPYPDLSVTIKTSGGALDISYDAQVQNNTASGSFATLIYVDGALASTGINAASGAANVPVPMNERLLIQVGPGTHKVDVYWVMGTGTLITGGNRTLTVREN